MDKTFPVLLSSEIQKSLLPKVENLNFSKEFEKFSETFRKSTETDSSFKDIKKTKKLNHNQKSKDYKTSSFLSSLKSPDDLRDPSFDFELILKSNIETPLCKCKYFQFQIVLKQLKTLELPRSETLEVKLEVLTNDGTVITKNMRGSDILKGGTSRIMHYFDPENSHVAYFRIQLTEVSSYYSQKSLNLRLVPQDSAFLSSTGCKVRSLLIPRLKIRAKRSSKDC